MPRGTPSSLGFDRTAIVLAVLSAALGVGAWVVSSQLTIPRSNGLHVLSIATTALAAAAIAGLWLRREWALWCALIAVSFAATIVCCAWALKLDPRLLAVACILIVATAAAAFAIGDEQGDKVSLYQRILFATVFAFAAWVAVWGWGHPAVIGRALPINAPPLHARFLGAMYLSGCCFMLLALIARAWYEISIAVAVLAVWTGMLGLVSALNVAAFDWSRDPTWFWFVAYFGFPLLAAWVFWCQRGKQAEAFGPPLRAPVRAALAVLGGIAAIVGIGLLFAPAAMVRAWPWAISPLLAQIYSAPFLAYGIGLLLAASRRHWIDVRIAVLGTLTFAIGVLVASSIHAGLFSRFLPSNWVWFGGFGLTAIFLLAISALPSVRNER